MDAHKLEDGYVGVVLSQDEADVLEAILLRTRFNDSSAKPNSPVYQVAHSLWSKLNSWRKLRVGDSGLPEVAFDVEGLDLMLKEAHHKYTLTTRS